MLQHPANRTHNPQFHTRPTTRKPKRQVPQAATIFITLVLLMMGIMVPETCWANNKLCNKETDLLHLVDLLFPRIRMNFFWVCGYWMQQAGWHINVIHTHTHKIYVNIWQLLNAESYAMFTFVTMHDRSYIYSISMFTCVTKHDTASQLTYIQVNLYYPGRQKTSSR